MEITLLINNSIHLDINIVTCYMSTHVNYKRTAIHLQFERVFSKDFLPMDENLWRNYRSTTTSGHLGGCVD